MSHDLLFERRASLTLLTTWRTTGLSWLCLLGILLQGFIIILNAWFIAITCFQLWSLCLPIGDFLLLVINTIMSPQVNIPPCPQASTGWFCQPDHQEALPSHLWPCHLGEVFFRTYSNWDGIQSYMYKRCLKWDFKSFSNWVKILYCMKKRGARFTVSRWADPFFTPIPPPIQPGCSQIPEFGLRIRRAAHPLRLFEWTS